MPNENEYVGPSGSVAAKLAIVGIAPSNEEVKAQTPFVGPSGQILNQALELAGIQRSEVYITNVFKYKLPDNDFERHTEIGLDLQQSITELTEEISAINPNCILGLGDPVLLALTGKQGTHNNIGTWRGSIIPALGHKSVFTWHPAASLHGQQPGSQWKPWQKGVMYADIARAVKESEYDYWDLPTRLLHIADSYYAVTSFFERNQEESFVAIDIEAIENIPICIGFAFTPYEAISIPLWNLLEINCTNLSKPKSSYSYKLEVSKISSHELTLIWNYLAKFLLNPKFKKIGQNFKYDEMKLNSLGFYLDRLYHDTSIAGHTISPELPKSLAFQTSIYTREPYYKFEGREYNPRRDKIKDFLLYNAKDCCCTIEIFHAQQRDFEQIIYSSDHFYDYRMPLHHLYKNIELTGFKIDEQARSALIEKYVKWSANLELELFQLTGEHVNTNSPKQVGELIYGKLKIPARKGTGEEVLTSILANVKTLTVPQKRTLNLILEKRRVDKTTGNYLAAEPDFDSRMRTSVNINGTETFRTSTSILKPPIRPTESGWALQTVTKHGDVGEDLRTILVADKGYIFLNVDQSTAEPRVCANLADDTELLKMLDLIDVHAFTASKIFDIPVEKLDKKIIGYEKPERFVGKTSRNAYNLGIGKHELMINVNTDAKKYHIKYEGTEQLLSISEYRAGEILKVLERITPRIQTVFHHEIQECLHRDRRIYATNGASRYFYGDLNRETYKEAYSLIPQQAITDNTKRLALWILKEIWDVKILIESHDALTMLVPEHKLDDYVPEILKQGYKPISFEKCSLPRNDLMIPWDAEIGYNYKDLKKYKRKLVTV